MKTNIRQKVLQMRLLRPWFHVIIILFSYFMMYNLRFYTDLIPFVQLRIPYMNFGETMLFGLLSWFLFVLIWIVYDVYELFKPIQSYYRKFLKTWIVWIMVISFISYYGFWFIFEWWISRFVLIWSSLISLIMLTIFDMFYSIFPKKFEKQAPYKLLFIYSDKRLFEKVKLKFDTYDNYVIKWEDIKTIIKWLPEILDVFDIVVSVGNFDAMKLQDIVDVVRLHGKTFYSIPESYFLEDLVYNPERLWPILAFEYKPSPLDGWFRVFKRLFDILLSMLSLILFWPLFLIIAILIKMDTKWPIFYIHKRVWKNWKLFDFIKFRSMHTHMSVWDKYWWDNAYNMYQDLIHSDKNKRKWPLSKIEDDPRITRIWKILRKTSLDELPQLWLVLIWDMSLIWPRPHMPDEVEKYKWRQKRLLSIKPWITGYSQLFGRHNVDFSEEAKLDLYYIQKWSIFLDIYVLITTIKVIFRWK